MAKQLHFIGDIIVVEPLDSNVTSSTLIIPQVHRTQLKCRRAKVLFVGKLTDFIRQKSIKKRMILNETKKKDTYFPGDDLQPNDIVWVREELGTRGMLEDYPTARVYDGEDVLAVEVE